MTPSSIDDRIAQLNQRLKAARLGVVIERRGDKLSLRGTFPPRPGSPRLRPYQQRVSLNRPATPGGLKQAEQDAKIVAAQLIQNTFNWRDYLPIGGSGRLDRTNLTHQLEAFERFFFTQPHRPEGASSRTTWEKSYAPYLRKLEAIAQNHPTLNLSEAIYATVQATPANSRSRQICCTTLAALASFLELDLPTELKSFWGNYGSSRTQMRALPTDDEILAVWQTIPNPTWQFVFGIMATYGLRNHEVFFCDYTRLRQGDPEATLEVLPTTKTGSHEVWPFYPEWVDQMGLRQGLLPPVNTNLNETTLQRVGQLVTNQFRRYNIPFAPYDLRHAWAVRTIHMGLPDTVAAKMMGHSVAVHNRTYHRWIARRDQQQAVTAALQRSGRTVPSG